VVQTLLSQQHHFQHNNMQRVNRKILKNSPFSGNGLNGLGIAWKWDYLNEPLADSYNLNSAITQFMYTTAGNAPNGAYNDDLNLNTAVVSFSYTL
jgi:hypothetical protein